MGCRDLELAVPGTYDPGHPVVKIAEVQGQVQVITSKQRPRKICIKGDFAMLKALFRISVHDGCLLMYVSHCI